MFDESPRHITGMAFIAHLLPGHLEPFAMVIAAVLASMENVKKKTTSDGFLFLVPQEFLLVLAAFGAAQAVWLGHFADGVIRPRAFLIADQGVIFLVALCHTLALLDRYSDIFSRKS